MENIRLLNADEIDVRVQSVIKAKSGSVGCILLLYKDARVDMKILDETFGVMGWKRKHDVVNDNLFCTVSVYNKDTQEWVDKQDVGVESYTEKQKGEASDAFKRACVNWGIGRELYTSPFIWVDLNEKEHYESEGKTKISPKVKFIVTEINYNKAREISGIVIRDNGGEIRYKLYNKDGIEKECGVCGEIITGADKKTPEQMSIGTKKMTKTAMCYDCFKKWQAEQKG